MREDVLSKMSVRDIMNRWPSAIGVFIDLKLHCVGCPLSAFQTLEDAAREHGVALFLLTESIGAAIEGRGAPRAGLEPARLRSTAADADPSPAASACRLPLAPPPPRR